MDCHIAATLSGPISQRWSVDNDIISRSFATRRKLRQKGGGGPVWKHMICWVGSQFDISYDFTFYHFSFLVLIARPCCWIHVSFCCNICPDRNLDVSALFKNSNAHNFLCESAPPCDVVKSGFRIKFRLSRRQMDFKAKYGFHRCWDLNSFEVCVVAPGWG